MKRGGVGGGKTITGLTYEVKVDLLKKLAALPGYEVTKEEVGHAIRFQGKVVAYSYRKRALYAWLANQGVNWEKVISRRLEPDDAIYRPADKVLHIIEMKYQETEGSVDEKPQTIAFKKQQYEKLVAPLGIRIDFTYLLNDWFEDPKYRDLLAYIRQAGGEYFIEFLPLSRLGLPEVSK